MKTVSAKDFIKEKGIENNTVYYRDATKNEIDKFLGKRVSKLIDEGIIGISENCEFLVIDEETVVLQRG